MLALDQFHCFDRKTRKEHFYLNRLTPPIDDKSCFAKSPLEVAVEMQQYELLLHPVMKELIRMKWKKFANFSALKSITVNFALVIFWTVLMCTRPTDDTKTYASNRKYWGPIYEGTAATTLIINIVLEIVDFVKSLQKSKRYKKWRQKEICKEFQYCHDRWPDERAFLERELQVLKDHKPSYAKDYWNIFDWITYSLMGLNVCLHFIEYKYKNVYTKRLMTGVASAMMVCMWLRLLKYVRPFKALGLFVIMTGHVVGDALKILFLAAHIFIPYMASFWINFGLSEVDGYSMKDLELFYNIFQMTIVGDYSYDNIAANDKIMAQLLCTSYIFLSGIICLNLFIALMSNTFQRVYDNAKANALMQRAACIVNAESNMSESKHLQHRAWIYANCAPQSSYYNDSKINPDNNEFIKKTDLINEKLDKLNETIECNNPIACEQLLQQFQQQFLQGNKSKPQEELNQTNSLLTMVNELKEEYQKSTSEIRAEITELGVILKDLVKSNESCRNAILTK